MEEQKDVMARHIETSSGIDTTAESSEPRVKQGTTKSMVFFAMYIGLAGWIFNFDLGYGGTVLQMNPYKKAFGKCTTITNAVTGLLTEKCSQTALQQGLVSVTFLFVAVGGTISGVTGTYLGRRGTIQVGCVLIAIGAGGMLGTAGNFTAYMVCKCIGGVGLGHLIAAAPVYGIECIAASKRGILMALYSIGLGFGTAAAAAVCWGSSTFKTSNLSWQIPIICQIPLSFILGFGILMFPESPRWLLVKGREEAAKNSFAWFYEKDVEHPDILLQVQDVLYHIELEKANGEATRWTDIYNRTEIRRTLTSGLIMVGLAITGSKFIGPYGAIFLAGVGIGNPFLTNFIVTMSTAVGSLFGPFIVDHGGRRFAQLCGYSSMTVCMLIIAAVGSGLGAGSTKAKTILLVFLFSWGFLFGAFIGTSVWVAAPEMHNIRLRTYGQASTTTIYQIFGFAASFYTPYMLSASYGNMGLNVGYFYGGLSAVVTVLVFLFVPETARLTLEQIDEHFNSGRAAWRTSTSRNKKIARGEAVDHSGEKTFAKGDV